MPSYPGMNGIFVFSLYMKIRRASCLICGVFHFRFSHCLASESHRDLSVFLEGTDEGEGSSTCRKFLMDFYDWLGHTVWVKRLASDRTANILGWGTKCAYISQRSQRLRVSPSTMWLAHFPPSSSRSYCVYLLFSCRCANHVLR
jgi:hypothetical protein